MVDGAHLFNLISLINLIGIMTRIISFKFISIQILFGRYKNIHRNLIFLSSHLSRALDFRFNNEFMIR